VQPTRLFTSDIFLRLAAHREKAVTSWVV